MLQPFQEFKGNPVALVVEERDFLIAVGGSGQVHFDFPYVHGGIPHPHIVLHTAAFLTVYLVVDEAAVGQILLAQPVAGDKVAAVFGFLVFEGTGTAVALHFQGDVQRRQDVLGGEDTEVVGA